MIFLILILKESKSKVLTAKIQNRHPGRKEEGKGSRAS